MREEIEEIRNIIYSNMNSIMCDMHYYNKGSWSGKFTMSEFIEKYTRLKEELSNIMTLDFWNSLTDQDCNDLMFGKFDESSKLRLIPIMYYDILPIGLEVTGIFDNTITIDEYYQYSKLEGGKDNPGYINADIRCGCLAYGIYPVDSKE